MGDLISTVLCNGQGNEGNESHEGHEEEAHLCEACQTSRLLWQDRQDRNRIEEDRPCAEQNWQDRQQEEGCPRQGSLRWLARSSCEGPQSSEHQGFLRYQEGHSTLQEGQGALSVSTLSNL